jgi:anti-anti-sigma factor
VTHKAPQVYSIRSARPHDFDHEAIVEPAGELDIATCEELEAALAAARQISCRVRVDLGRVSFLDASTLGVLDAADRTFRDQGGALSIHGESARQRRLFQLGSLDRLLRTESVS